MQRKEIEPGMRVDVKPAGRRRMTAKRRATILGVEESEPMAAVRYEDNGALAIVRFARLVALALVLLALLGAAPAHAEEWPSTSVSLDFPVMRAAVVVADEYWATRNITVPPFEGAYELPAEERYAGISALGEPSGGRIWLAAENLEFLRSFVRQVSVRSRAILCYTVIHERGHNAGLLHSDAGTFPIMAPADAVGAGWIRKSTAPRCWHWAKHPFG